MKKPAVSKAASTPLGPVARPKLIVQTVCFSKTDRDEARRLGEDIYDLLSRPAEDRLSFGAGVPVFSAVSADRVDPEAAEIVVIVPVLGAETFSFTRDDVVKQINDWHRALGPSHVLPVPVSENWRQAESSLPGVQLLSKLYEKGDRDRATADEIVLGIARLLREEGAKPMLFISHAKGDLKRTGNVAKKIFDYVETNTSGKAFYDTRRLLPGDSLSDQLEEAIEGSVLVAVRTDSYSSREWCQRELLLAKRKGLPTLTVEVLDRGERRAAAYGGNGPSMRWNDDPGIVGSRAMVEWIGARLFRREATRIADAAGLPDAIIMSRPPELLDLAVGSLSADRAQVVMYPDPELPVAEREILFLGGPRLHLATPTTAYRYLREGRGDVDSPLDGFQVAMSLSDSPDAGGPDGYTKHHVDDAIVHVARCLVSAGATIAYGGDFRVGGYTELLSQLIAAYNQTGRTRNECLHSYLAAHMKGGDMAVTAHHLQRTPEMRAEAMLTPPDGDPGDRAALYFSDMRRVMSLHVDARVILGGGTQPRTEEDGDGYGGRYPGVVEEAWRTLQVKRPLYVCGGFGGSAALVADLLEGGETPEVLRDENWSGYPYYWNRAQALDVDSFREKLGLPRTMQDLAQALRDEASPLIASDESALAWNGLTLAENRLLFRTRDVATQAALIFKGLLAVCHKQAEGKLAVELVHGSVTHARGLDVVSVPVSDNVPIGGAAGALDRALGGLLSVVDTTRQPLHSVRGNEVDTDWVHLANLGPSLSQDRLPGQVERAAGKTVACVQRHGFRRLGVVLYGGTVGSNVGDIVAAMVERFEALAGQTTLVWFETDADRYQAIRDALRARKSIHLTTRAPVVEPPATPRSDTLLLQVRLGQDELETTFLPPSGTALAGTRRTPMSDEDIARLSGGTGSSGRSTPEIEELEERGALLAEALLGDKADDVLDRCKDARVLILHDVPASKIPFEMLATTQHEPPATKAGLSRRLAVEGARSGALFAKPPRTGPLEVLVVIDPNDDLDGAQDEGKAVAEVLDKLGHVLVKKLKCEEATKSAVLKHLADADVLHFCGHAFFNGPGADQSGLVLADSNLTIDDIVGLESLPRVAFVNACEAGRVRGEMLATEAAAFAEFFLRSGIEAYLGTHWRVGDEAATQFATNVYKLLAAGDELHEAVREARERLLQGDPKLKDWANYILYGEGRFRLVST